MTLHLQTSAQLFDLHCSVGLTDWDMDKELKLVTTTDQFCHDDKLCDPDVAQSPLASAWKRKDEFVWYDKTSEAAMDQQILQEHAEEVHKPVNQCSQATNRHRFSPQGEKMRVLPSSTDNMDDCTSCDTTHCRRDRRHTEVWNKEILMPGCWPRPPVNYCILIALALKSSHNGSLRVQQIYSFTREHFPFFQTAPDGWKNTIRHNLCFNTSFRKTCNQMRRDGKRKSCFWHLTQDGRRRLKAEICMLSEESLKQLERSMSFPDIIAKLLRM
ncbi:forkhead box protein R1 isoform X2 [Syngnathoides biaculeatus]|uniref:forkhead box protein R1 isoform X2 n=1 Tax=Syngnathoides biaculeatus TaxID=300417 RepID=UPI002ADDE2D0|nr:forkhead box protein R1 isoform X2 [Syngnathoides biaculeatus]